MITGAAEKRPCTRVASSGPAAVLTADGRVLARGLTGNVSASGVFIIARMPDGPPSVKDVVVELTCAAGGGALARRGDAVSRYRGRIVRTVRLGRLVGIGIELIEPVELGEPGEPI